MSAAVNRSEASRAQHREYNRKKRALDKLNDPEKWAASKERAKQWHLDHPKESRAIQERYLSRLLAKREAIAGRPRPAECELCGGRPTGRHGDLHFDHNHSTGSFRGWLCTKCNMAIGLLNDDPMLVRTVAFYLEMNGWRYTPVADQGNQHVVLLNKCN